MALINCPECDNEISDKAEFCPKCGYKLPKKEPMFQGVYCPSCLESNIKTGINACPYCNIKFKDSIYGTSKDCSDYGENHPELKESPDFNIEAYNRRINYVPIEYSSSHAIKCPYCQSANTKKISATSKASSVALFGIFAMGKVSKQWHCNDCNSDF